MSNLSNSDPVPKSNAWLGYAPWLAGTFALILVVTYWLVFSTLPWKESPASWGAFGDYIGGLLNPTIALFTLIVAVSVWQLQRQQLEATQKELIETRNAIREQTFDQFFMSVLASHRAMSEQVSVPNPNISNSLLTGKAAIDVYLKEVNGYDTTFTAAKNSARSNRSVGYSDNLTDVAINKTLTDALMETFNVWRLPIDWPLSRMAYFCTNYYQKELAITSNLIIENNSKAFENLFGHIFRFTYQILKLIDEQFREPADKKRARRYVNLLRAQMSESEFVFFALSALTLDGQKSWARSVRLNFFEDRLQNSDWTKLLGTVFEATPQNIEKANTILREDENAD